MTYEIYGDAVRLALSPTGFSHSVCDVRCELLLSDFPKKVFNDGSPGKNSIKVVQSDERECLGDGIILRPPIPHIY